MACPVTVLTGAFWIAVGATNLCLDDQRLDGVRQIEVQDDRERSIYLGTQARPSLACVSTVTRVRSRLITRSGMFDFPGPWSAWSDPHLCLGKSPDLTGDGMVGGMDFGAFVVAYPRGDLRADLNGDGKVGGPDFGLFTKAYGGQVR